MNAQAPQECAGDAVWFWAFALHRTHTISVSGDSRLVWAQKSWHVAEGAVTRTAMLGSVLMGLLSTAPAVGDVVPDFTTHDTEGVELTLSKLIERGAVVLAFYPKAFTPG